MDIDHPKDGMVRRYVIRKMVKWGGPMKREIYGCQQGPVLKRMEVPIGMSSTLMEEHMITYIQVGK
jgi:hypothetical protein